MSKPTPEELDLALTAAAIMSERKQDEHYLAKCLLNLNYRVAYLEKVFKAAERYVYFGQEEREHQLLIKAIEQARDEELHITKKEEQPNFGL
ncbi:MAG: hypothetical protein OQK04_09880 [Kangiellaceae bacterium]|nr:hypothetical protein [Kangiellaceae bacterium]MCW8999012.1 hypothetical protein [Kangiellaceae bacterium]